MFYAAEQEDKRGRVGARAGGSCEPQLRRDREKEREATTLTTTKTITIHTLIVIDSIVVCIVYYVVGV